jgi:peptidylprolyl isomerase
MTRTLFAALASFLLLFAMGCEGKEKAKAPELVEAGLAEINKIDEKVGDGQTAEKGDMVYMTYTGKLKNGYVFDTNDKPSANPFNFELGGGSVIKGWDEGIVGMKVGGTRRLEIPAKLAYGAQPPPGSGIPPNADLYFDVKLLDLVKKGEEDLYDKTDLKVGTGPQVQNGDSVTIHYVVRLANGRRADSSYERKKPESFKVGKGDVIRGLDYGIVGMKQGGKRKLRIPPNIGYGPYGLGQLPPDSVVNIEIDLLKVQKG